MGITVRQAMQMGGLAHSKVIAGEGGLDRIIDSITVMEVPDVVRWLDGNVLLLSSLYPIKDDEEAIRSLVPQLAETGNSALAIKTQAYVEQIPEAIIEAGNWLNFPIIEIPNHIAYLDIMTPLMEHILQRQDQGSKRLEDFYQWIKELALGGKGIAALTDAIEQMTGNAITVGSELSSLELFKGVEAAPLTRIQHKELRAAKRPVRMQRLLNKEETSCIVAPLLWNEEVWGDITCWQTTREFVEQDFHVMDRAMMLIALEFHKEITKQELEQSLRNLFLTDLLLSRQLNTKEVLEKGSMFGWDFSKSYQVVCIRAEYQKDRNMDAERNSARHAEGRRRLFYKVSSLFRYDSRQAIVTEVRDFIVLLLPREIEGEQLKLPYPKDPLKGTILSQMERIREQLLDLVPDECLLQIGIGRFYHGLAGIHKGYEEASQAIQLGKARSAQSPVHFEDLGIYRLLTSVQDLEELRSLQSETIGRLADYDSINESDLVNTLKQYFECNGSVSDTAKKLFVHVNTIKYRLQKIEQITGCNVQDVEQQFLLFMGLKIDGMLKVD